MTKKDYYLGLDIGTNSVGYAVTDENYNLLKFKGEAMWGSHVFEEGNQSAERRTFRTARRRLNRRKQRINLVREIFAKEIFKVDENFYRRLDESFMYREDAMSNESFIFFNDNDYDDAKYNKEYPTIHHLIMSLINENKPHDVRLVYMATAWIVLHRGHFLSEVDENSVEKVLDFNVVYGNLMSCLEENEIGVPWTCNPDDFKNVLKEKIGVKAKEDAFKSLLFDGKFPKDNEETVISISNIIKLLSGGKTKVEKVFLRKEYADSIDLSLKKNQEDFEATLAELDEEIDLLICLRAVYDWSLLYEASAGNKFVSEAKISIYNQHKEDLALLKYFIKKYLPGEYNNVFRIAKKDYKNYVAYSYNMKGLSKEDANLIKEKAMQEEFCDFIKKILKDIQCEDEDMATYLNIIESVNSNYFMPKQVNGDNRVIPYQLYYYELKNILQRVSTYLPFLNEKDGDNISNMDKILSIMKFRVPYYVGPIHKENSENAWIVRKAKGRIYPWNFDEKVDRDKSEADFINRMTNTCTYIPGEDVLPKNSLLYSKFEVLNEINNIKINGGGISIKCKQEIYELFKRQKKVSRKNIENYLISNNYAEKEDVISGIDITIKSSLKSYHAFRNLIENKKLTYNQVEDIIRRLAYTEEKVRIRRYLDINYPALSDEDKKYISKLKLKDFGRLSEKFLSQIEGFSKETGETGTVIDLLWNTNDNLMQIIESDNYTFKETISRIKEEYFGEHSFNVETLLDDMYISNAVKRPIYRTLDIVKDVKKACKNPPRKIFIEMTRGGGEKGKRSVSRRKTIEEYYKNFSKQDVREISQLLDSKTDNELRSEVLYLYFMQLGKCLYSGIDIDIERIKDDNYVNVDHIYPQAYVKDDSLDNKVLVLSKLNGEKSNKYPISSKIREKMYSTWTSYCDKGLISKEKYKRLTRNIPFSDDEKQGFIRRQLVETSQSTKAIATILKTMFPKTEIVYSKARLTSEFREEYKIVKTRIINDLHHAKDAYLNIVCGNVYDMKFNKRYFSVHSEYSLKIKNIFDSKLIVGDKIIWDGEESIEKVKNILRKNNIHYTRYAFCRKGGFFDRQPLPAALGLIERKTGLNTEKYGGYSKSTASFFILTRYKEIAKKEKMDIMIVPVDLMVADRVLNNRNFAIGYLRKIIANISNKNEESIDIIDFPLGLRPLKVNTRFKVDGFEMALASKNSGGKMIKFTSLASMSVGYECEIYIKKIEKFNNRLEKNKELKVVEKYDGINKIQNIELYNLLLKKMKTSIYRVMCDGICDLFEKGKEIFKELSVEEQIKSLAVFINIFKSGRSNPCDLTSIKGSKNSMIFRNSSKLSNWKKSYNDVRIIDISASGLFKSETDNLLELL